MAQQAAAAPIDRPPPGHYQVMLSTVLSRSVPVGEIRPSPPPSGSPRRVSVRLHTRRTGQMALPLESSGARLRERR